MLRFDDLPDAQKGGTLTFDDLPDVKPKGALTFDDLPNAGAHQQQPFNPKAVAENVAPNTTSLINGQIPLVPGNHPIASKLLLSTPVPAALDVLHNVVGRPVAAVEGGIAEAIQPAPKFTATGENIAQRNIPGVIGKSFVDPRQAPLITERVPYTPWESEGSPARLIPRALAEAAIQYGLTGGVNNAPGKIARAIEGGKGALVRRGIVSPDIVVPKGWKMPTGSFSEAPVVEAEPRSLPAPTQRIASPAPATQPPATPEAIPMPAPKPTMSDLIAKHREWAKSYPAVMPSGKVPVRYVGPQMDDSGNLAFQMVDEPSGSTVAYDPAKHEIVQSRKGVAVPPEIGSQSESFRPPLKQPENAPIQTPTETTPQEPVLSTPIPAVEPKPVFALKLKDGRVVEDASVKNHVDLVEKYSISPDDVQSTGFVSGGQYQTKQGNVRPELQKMYAEGAKEAGYDLREGAATGAKIAPIPEAPKVGEERYQWMRNAQGGQQFGNQQIIRPMTEADFQKDVKPKLRKGYANTLAEYQAKHPDETHISYIKRHDSDWFMEGSGSLEELRPKNKAWAKKVGSFESQEAIQHGETADQPEPVAKSVQEGVPDRTVTEPLKLQEEPYGAHRHGVDRLYHETSADNAVSLAFSLSDKMGLNVASDPSMALGQGGKGALIEFANTQAIGVQVSKHKPGLAVANAVSGKPQEFRILRAPSDGRKIVASITFQPKAAVSKVSKQIMVRSGWTKETLPDGSIKFTNPALSSPQTPTAAKEGELFQQSGTSVPSTFQTEADKVQAILDKHGVQDVVVKLVDAIQTPSGGKAVGSFVPGQGVVKLTPSPMSTTGYHEAFHVLVRRAGVGDDLSAALFEMRRKFGAKDVQEAEEMLADEFARYANRQTSPKWSDRLKAFFDKIMAHIKQLFGKDSRARRLFDELLNPRMKAGEARPLGGEAFQEAPKKPRNMLAMASARRDAVAAVMRDLREQAKILNQDRIELRQNVIRAGGIKPTLGGGMREELQSIKPYLRQNGQPIDALATELGFPDGEALRNALAAARTAKIPSMIELKRQAESIINSDQGNAILEAVQSEGAASKAAKRIIRDATEQMNEVISDAGKKAASLLKAGEKRELTPSQVGRMAREQRIEPGATVEGPKGGKREALLSEADIRRATAATEALVPPPGQPTGTPPKIPRNKALVSTEYRDYDYRDLTEFQSGAFSGFDPHRAAEWIDKKPLGPTFRKIVEPVRKAEIEKRRENISLIQDLRRVSHHMKRKSKESSMLADYIEGKHLKEMEPVPAHIKATASWMRDHYDDLIDRVNDARAAVGKRPILKRQDYMTHLSEDQSLWEQTLGALSSEPDDKMLRTAGKIKELIRGKAPFFRFGLPRKGGEYAKDAIKAFETYADTALRVIHMTRPGRVADVYLSNLPPRAQEYFGRYLDKTVHGRLGPIAKLTPAIVRRVIVTIKSRFAKGTILGNISSVAQQPFTLPATISATGTRPATMAVGWLARGDGMAFAERYSDTLRGRMFELDLAERGMRNSIENFLAIPLEAADRALVAHAFLSGYIDAVQKGATWYDAIEAGDRIAQRTQASFLEADLAPIFQDEVTSGFVQFQNTINGVFNYMFHDIKNSDHALYRALLFAGSFAALAGIYEELGIPHPDEISDFVPGLSSMRGGPAALRIISLAIDSGSNDKQKAAKAKSDLSRILLSLTFPGANQVMKTGRGFEAIQRGGVYSKKGRMNFPVRGTTEGARALVFGPYGTKAGQAYIKRGFKPEPVPESQKILNKQMGNFKRSLMK